MRIRNVNRRTRSILLLSAVILIVVVVAVAPALMPLGRAGTARAAEIQPLHMVVAAESGSPNPVINYQGRLLNPTTGFPVNDGSYQIAFRLYNVESGGAELWVEAHTVPVNRSVFTVLLGSIAPLNMGVFNGQPLWLGVTVGADPEMTPRQRVAHTAYAILAERVKDGAVTGASIADGAVGSADVADESLGAADLAAGSVGASEIQPNSVDSGRILDAGIKTADIGPEQVDASHLQNLTRSILIPAGAFSFDPASTTVARVTNGLSWNPTYQGGANAIVARPVDWDGAAITIKMYYYATSAAIGSSGFFVRPKAIDPPESYVVGSNPTSTKVNTAGLNIVVEQAFTVPNAYLGASDDLWYFQFQRIGANDPGSPETYNAPVVLMAFEIRYGAVR